MANEHRDDSPNLFDQPVGSAAASSVTRRDAIAAVAGLLGGTALIGGTGLLAGCADLARRTAITGTGIGNFSATDVAFLDEIADTILPETDTPGAKAAQTGAFMALMVTDAYDPRERRAFRAGMRRIERTCKRMHGVSFPAATPAQRLAVLEPLDREQKAETDARDAARLARLRAALTAPPDDGRPPSRAAAEPVAHYFRMMKELALLGYFTSEIGYTEAMRYIESPGRFDPCVPHSRGERAWASHA